MGRRAGATRLIVLNHGSRYKANMKLLFVSFIASLAFPALAEVSLVKSSGRISIEGECKEIETEFRNVRSTQLPNKKCQKDITSQIPSIMKELDGKH